MTKFEYIVIFTKISIQINFFLLAKSFEDIDIYIYFFLTNEISFYHFIFFNSQNWDFLDRTAIYLL